MNNFLLSTESLYIYLLPYCCFLVFSSLSIILISSFRYKKIYIYSEKSVSKVLLKLSSAFRVIEYPREPFFIKNGVLHIYQGGIDSVNYKYLYDKVADIDFITFVRNVLTEEFIYYFSNWVFAYLFHLPFSYFLVFYYLLFSLCIIKLTKLISLDIHYILCIFCIQTMYLVGFNIFRQTIAVFFSIFIIEAMLQERYIKCFFLIIIGMGFHSTSIVFFIPLFGFYLLKNAIYNEKKIYIYILLVCICFAIIGKGIKFFNIRHSADTTKGALSYSWLATYIFLIFIYRRKKKYCSKYENKLYFIAICFIPIFVFQSIWAMAYRFMLFSKPIVYILLVRLAKIKINTFDFLFYLITDLIFIGVIVSFISGIYQIGLPYESYLFLNNFM